MPIGDPVSPELVQKFREAGYWPTTSNLDYLERNATVYPDKEALVDKDHRLTFRQFCDLSKRLALGFYELGLRKGDMVVAQIPNSAEFMVILYAMRRIGVIPLFLTMDLRVHEVSHALDRSEAVGVMFTTGNPQFDFTPMYRDQILPHAAQVKYVFVLGDETPEGTISIRRMLTDPAETRHTTEFLKSMEPDVEDTWNLTSTSGTTALPKFALLKENTVNGAEIARRARLSPDDICLVIAPLRGGGSNVYKYAFMMPAMKGVFQDRFDAEEALQLIEQERCTLVAAVPAQLIKMLDCPNFDKYDLNSMRMAYYAGAALPLEAAQQLRQRMGVEIMGEYGSMDAGIIFAVASLDDPTRGAVSHRGQPFAGRRGARDRRRRERAAPGSGR